MSVTRRGGISSRSMRRNRIMNQGADSQFGEFGLQRIALRMADDKQMPYRVRPVRRDGQDQAGIHGGKLCEIRSGYYFATLVPSVEVAEFDAQEGRLQFVQAGVQAGHFVVITFLRTVIAQHADLFRQFAVVGGDCARVAESAEVFGRIKTVARGVSERA